MKYLLANFKTNKNWQELQVYFEKLSNFYESNSDLKNNKTIIDIKKEKVRIFIRTKFMLLKWRPRHDSNVRHTA